MKVLVTGAQGFIGQYVVEELISRGYDVIAFDRYDKGHRPEGSEFFLGDIADDVAVTEAFAHADSFIHLAGVLGTQETIENPRPAARVNLLGGLNILMAAKQYDVPGVNIAVGNWWMNNTYSITKNMIERFVAMFNKEHGTRINIVRPTNAFGPRQASFPPHGSSKVKKITPAFVNAAIRDLPIGVYGDGKQISDMAYVGDVAKVLVNAMEAAINGDVYEKPFEIGYGYRLTVNEVAEKIIELAGSESTLKHSPMRPGEEVGGVILADPETCAPLGITSKDLKPLDEALLETIEYYRGQVSS